MDYKVVIYSGGKCAGSSLLYSLLMEGIKSTYIHSDKQYLYCKRNGIFSEVHGSNNKSIFENVSENCIFIDIYRNPIDRAISSYFENYKHNKKYFNIPTFDNLEDEVNYFQINIFHELENYEGFRDVMKYYGLNKLENKGNYWIGKKDKKLFIRLKFDKIKDWENIIMKELDIKIKLKTKLNSSDDKDYKVKYENFKKIYYKQYGKVWI